MRVFLFIVVVLLLSLAGYAYYKNPAGCRKVGSDLVALLNSLSPIRVELKGDQPDQPAPVTVPSVAPKAFNPPAVMPSQPHWTWTTLDGQSYQEVQVIAIHPDSVTIQHSLGGTQIPLSNLPADLKGLLTGEPVSMQGVMPIASVPGAPGSPVSTSTFGKLVTADGSNWTPVGDIQYFAIYYAAQSNPASATFTPHLVEWYNKFKPLHPNFEVIFVSDDRSQADMQTFMKGLNMPWPALAYHDASSNWDMVAMYRNAAIPDLVLVDTNGKILSDSLQGMNDVGPAKVVADINTIVGGSSPIVFVAPQTPATTIQPPTAPMKTTEYLSPAH